MMTVSKLPQLRQARNMKLRLVWGFIGAFAGALLTLLVVFFVFGGNLVSISNEQSLGLPDQNNFETTVKVDALLSLCGAQVEAQYAGFTIYKEHEVLGKVYRTDRIDGDGTTKVGICVDVFGYEAEVTDERVVVTVQPDSVRMLLPSVDHWQTDIDYNDGADIFSLNPLIAENNDLTDVVFMWLQLQATEGVCVDAAWEVVVEQIEASITENERVRGLLEGREISIEDVIVNIDAPASLDAARSRVLKEIEESGPRASYALELINNDEEIRVDEASLSESCEVVIGK